jgi:hypothetical protein
MLRLTAQYADLWNIGYMGHPDTMAAPLARINAACREVERDPATLGVTALIGLSFSDLQPDKPSYFDNPQTRDRGGDAWLRQARRAAPHVSVRAPYTPAAPWGSTVALGCDRADHPPAVGDEAAAA